MAPGTPYSDSTGGTPIPNAQGVIEALRAGDLNAFQTILAGGLERISKMPAPTPLTVDVSMHHIASEDAGMGLESRKKAEHDRIAYATSLHGQSKLTLGATSGRFDKMGLLQAFQSTKENAEMRVNLFTGMMGKEEWAKSASFITIPEPYAPCSKALQDLQEMKLKELRLESHHRDRYVVVKGIVEPLFERVNILTVVEDENGEVDLLAFEHAQQMLGQEVMPKGGYLAIKEPYYTVNKNKASWYIRVDHPSNIVRLPHTSSMLPPAWRLESLAVNNKTAADWKKEGNDAVKLDTASGYQQAVNCYTAGLASIEDQTELKLDLFRNRALANLELGRYDAAQKDACDAISGSRLPTSDRMKDLDYKAYRRAALATYHLRQWRKAEDMLNACVELRPDGDNKDVNRLLAKVKARLREEDTGTYDFDSIIANLGTKKRVDAADFIKRTEVKPSPGRGRGLFATEDIPFGGIILIEKASHIMFENDDDFYTSVNYEAKAKHESKNHRALWQSIVRELDRNPSRLPTMLSLFDGSSHEDEQETEIVDGQSVIDVFRIRNILINNLYQCPTPTASQTSTAFAFGHQGSNQNGGIWPRASMMNHSCVGNASLGHIGDLMIVRAARPIEKGDEIFSQYRNEADFDIRGPGLEENWGIKCDCPLCVADRSQSPNTRARRRALFAQFQGFLSKDGVPDTKLGQNWEKAMGVHLALVKTYDSVLHQSVPRMDSGVMIWELLKLGWIYQPTHQVFDVVELMAREMGIVLDLKQAAPVFGLTNNSVCQHFQGLVTGLLIAAKLKEGQGMLEAKEILESHAQRIYRIINGVENGFESLRKFVADVTAEDRAKGLN